jgi:biopolymer transport protein ExbD
MFHGSEKSNSAMNEVNVIPLIDVSLVLVVILMLLTPLGLESKIGLNRAVAAARASTTQKHVERLEVAVLDESEIRVNRQVVTRENLAEALRPHLTGEVPPPVMISCADAVSHGTFVGVLDVAKQCGAVEIAVTESAP